MSLFELDRFIHELRQAAVTPRAEATVERIMRSAFRHPDAIRNAMSGYEGEDELLFEDETVSVWYCGFDPDRHVPPHNHRTTAIIGVYRGEEINHFYQPGDGTLVRTASRELIPGSVLRMSPTAIHSVETAGDDWSYGIHVYLAPLTTISRSLFDWDTGAAEPFSEDRFAELTKQSLAQTRGIEPS